MKERPILFSAPMVRALLDGTKTQTRRTMKPQPFGDRSDDDVRADMIARGALGADESLRGLVNGAMRAGFVDVRYPYGVPGDRLWVKETWRPILDGSTMYRADDAPQYDGPRTEGLWKSSLFMPRVASRITLEITDVRVERLQGISEADAIAEGLQRTSDGSAWQVDVAGRHYSADPVDSYASLWESINGAGSWDANPWVWVVEFKVLA